MIAYCWVVTHKDTHDDEESLERALSSHVTNAHDAWTKFIALVGKDKKTWVARGYVARRVCVVVKFC